MSNAALRACPAPHDEHVQRRIMPPPFKLLAIETNRQLPFEGASGGSVEGWIDGRRLM